MLGIGSTELVIIIFFGFLIFGPEKLPAMGRTVGRAIRQFREASDEANKKFREEVYDPFKEAVEPYAQEVQNSQIKEDLDAISGTFKETKELFTDPFKAAASGDGDDEGSGSAQGTPSIKNMVDDMVNDPFGVKAAEKAERDASVEASLAQADAIVEAVEGRAAGGGSGKVKRGLAESLYGLGDDAAAAATPGAPAKGGE